ncbi:MAG TPA: hypothetical protein VLA58_08885 [Chitinophagaceae bacterium]|nr:hypothetical protein [Chitinophagaceae bacterium]
MAQKHKGEVFPYIVVLKKKHEKTAALIGLLSAFIFIILLIVKIIGDPRDWIFMVLAIICFSGLLAYDIVQFRKKKKTEMMLTYLVAIGALFFFPLPGKIAYLVIALSGYLSTRPEEIGFSEDHIVFKSVFSKTIAWSDLNNALIKDGILTLDYKNNKLFQSETDDDEDNDEYEVSEEEFNAFCRKQLAVSSEQ